MIEQTLCILKPDLVANSAAVASVLLRFMVQGLTPRHVRVLNPMTREQAEQLYVEHVGKSFYEPNIAFMTSGPSIAVVVASVLYNSVGLLRHEVGATNPKDARPDSIRFMFGTELPRNAVHASATLADAEREIVIFFPEVRK